MHIPYEKQHNTFSCGAASLAMIYRALGRATTQDDIWPMVGRKEGASRWASPTYKLCHDALRRGLTGMVIQARPNAAWTLLEQCHRHGLFAILHHQFDATVSRRHFSVLVDWSADQVTLHDPQQGPDRQHTREAFLSLWGPQPRQYGGHFMVVLAEPGQSTAPCAVCGQAPPAEKTCPRCQQAIRFEPASALGCGARFCTAALWARVFCPQCDNGLIDLA